MSEDTQVNSEIEDLKKQIAALSAKNKELLDEKKSTKSGAERLLADAQEKIDELTMQVDQVKKDYEKQIKALAKERDDAAELAKSEQSANQRLLVDNGLTDALTKAGVRKELLAAARAMLKEQGIISIESEGDMRKAVAKLEDGKMLPLNEYIEKHFAASDVGKAFMPASRDSGAGASGSSANVGLDANAERLAQYNALASQGRMDEANAVLKPWAMGQKA